MKVIKKRFDMKKTPNRQGQFIKCVAWLISKFFVIWHRTKIYKIDVEDLKPPYIMLCNHNSFYDFMVMEVALFPHRANFIVAVDAFTHMEWLMRRVGCVPKRKFTNSDITNVKHIMKIIKNGDVAAFYPEARYSLCGTTAVLPKSLGKLIKKLNVPVVMLMMHGNHITQPVWNPKDRHLPTTAYVTKLFTPEELEALSVDEINDKLWEAFYYDDFKWQKENKIEAKHADRAEGLHKTLYQCPNCKTEHRMDSKGDKIFCTGCGKSWTMSVYGELSADEGHTEFSHIPDWYEWERAQVREEVRSGKYKLFCNVRVESIPNSHGFLDYGTGTLSHDAERGFVLKGTGVYGDFELERPVWQMYSCHIENEYRHDIDGDCIDLSTLDDTYFVFPLDKDVSITKIALATEELYYMHQPDAEPKKYNV